ncbi:MAG: T9SS type A sorting domain-containing protein [Lentimicrobium sp.]|nr:T9SS type A sorting domain-containing protein [Lentimicrobium sp.]
MMHPRTLLKYLIASILLNFVSFDLFAQSNTILDRFTATESNGKIYLSWIISSGQTCDGTIIMRSTDKVDFSMIGEIFGVCGSSSKPVPYSFVDESPVLNAVNYYYLELGTSGFSEIISVEIIGTGNDGYQVRPNPVADKAQIFFENKKNESHELWLYNLSGKPIVQLNTNREYFDFDTTGLSPGLYIFSITNLINRTMIKGKIVVKH